MKPYALFCLLSLASAACNRAGAAPYPTPTPIDPTPQDQKPAVLKVVQGVGADPRGAATASCPEGRVVGGGCEAATAAARIFTSAPAGNGWICGAFGTNDGAPVTATVQCLVAGSDARVTNRIDAELEAGRLRVRQAIDQMAAAQQGQGDEQ